MAGGRYESVLLATDIPLTPLEALSGIFGSISLAAWIFLLVPQLFQNYKQGSAEGISLTFLIVWFIGDVTNFFGAIWAGLVPIAISLAVYFCFADLVLITQCLYYNFINAQKERQQSTVSAQSDANDPEQPLLERRISDAIGLPGSRRRSSAARSHRLSQSSGAYADTALKPEERTQSKAREWLTNALSIVLVCLAGAAGWLLAWKLGIWSPAPVDVDDNPRLKTAIGAQVLGYASAACYLGARVPQIIKNYRDQSCEGLSLLFFLLSLLGNATYGAGILFHSTQRNYVMVNLPWLIGSLGTMAEDVIIFVQFSRYSDSGLSTSAVN